MIADRQQGRTQFSAASADTGVPDSRRELHFLLLGAGNAGRHHMGDVFGVCMAVLNFSVSVLSAASEPPVAMLGAMGEGA